MLLNPAETFEVAVTHGLKYLKLGTCFEYFFVYAKRSYSNSRIFRWHVNILAVNRELDWPIADPSSIILFLAIKFCFKTRQVFRKDEGGEDAIDG